MRQVIRRGGSVLRAAKTASAAAIAAFMRAMWSRTFFSSAFASARSGLNALRLPNGAPTLFGRPAGAVLAEPAADSAT
jgi:hypothetical protein